MLKCFKAITDCNQSAEPHELIFSLMLKFYFLDMLYIGVIGTPFVIIKVHEINALLLSVLDLLQLLLPILAAYFCYKWYLKNLNVSVMLFLYLMLTISLVEMVLIFLVLFKAEWIFYLLVLIVFERFVAPSLEYTIDMLRKKHQSDIEFSNYHAHKDFFENLGMIIGVTISVVIFALLPEQTAFLILIGIASLIKMFSNYLYFTKLSSIRLKYIPE